VVIEIITPKLKDTQSLIGMYAPVAGRLMISRCAYSRPERGAALHTLTCVKHNWTGGWGTCSPHIFEWLAQSRGDLINIQQVRCLCAFFLTLLVMAWVVIWREAWNEVQAAFLTLILGRMYHRGACRVLVHRTHITSRPTFSESIQLCVRHHWVNYAAWTIVERWNCISMILWAI